MVFITTKLSGWGFSLFWCAILRSPSSPLVFISKGGPVYQVATIPAIRLLLTSCYIPRNRRQHSHRATTITPGPAHLPPPRNRCVLCTILLRTSSALRKVLVLSPSGKRPALPSQKVTPPLNLLHTTCYHLTPQDLRRRGGREAHPPSTIWLA